MSLCATALVLTLAAASARAQNWSQYFAFEDFFNIEFPGEPIVRDTSYETEFGITLPARVYTAEDDFGDLLGNGRGLARGAGSTRCALRGLRGLGQRS